MKAMNKMKEIAKRATKIIPFRGNGQEEQRREAVKDHSKASESIMEILGRDEKRNRKAVHSL